MSYANILEEIQRRRAEVRRLEQLAEREARAMQPLTEQDERQMATLQSRADSAYQAAGRRAPPPLAHERVDAYQRRLVAGVQSYSPRWAKADIDAISADALPIAESQIYADAASHGRTHGLAARQIREHVSCTSAGHTQVEFVGGPEAHFIRAFERPARRATFRKPEEYTAMARDTQMAAITNAYHRPTVQSPRASF
jgi:hypothetical protein